MANLPPYALQVIFTVSFSLYGPLTDGRSMLDSSRITTCSGGTADKEEKKSLHKLTINKLLPMLLLLLLLPLQMGLWMVLECEEIFQRSGGILIFHTNLASFTF